MVLYFLHVEQLNTQIETEKNIESHVRINYYLKCEIKFINRSVKLLRLRSETIKHWMKHHNVFVITFIVICTMSTGFYFKLLWKITWNCIWLQSEAIRHHIPTRHHIISVNLERYSEMYKLIWIRDCYSKSSTCPIKFILYKTNVFCSFNCSFLFIFVLS